VNNMNLPANDNVARHKLLTFPELKSLKGIPFTRRHIDRMEANGDFPVRVAVGQRHVAWVESEIDEHVSRLMTARPARKVGSLHS
jgi:predicted DNA-binding transcriptional regulator AlpA